MVTIKELQEIKSQVLSDMTELEDYNKRGKRYVPEDNRVKHTTLRYTCWIINWLLGKMKPGNISYNRKVLQEMLISQDWKAISYSGRAYSGNALKEVLNDKSKDTLLGYAYQTVYLEKASRYLVELLDVPYELVGSGRRTK